MKLVIFGLTVTSSWGNGHATLWRGLMRALADRGCEITFFERDVPYYAEHRDLTQLTGATIILYADWASVRTQARAVLQDADVAIVTSYCPDGRMASALVCDSPVQRVFYDLDTPVTLARLSAGDEVAYLPPEGLGAFDLVLSYTGGRALQALTQRLGARVARALYGHVDPDHHRPAPQDERFRADLSYLGTYAPDRQPMLQRLFLDVAAQSPVRRFVIGGAGYPADFPWAPNIWFLQHVAPPDHCGFFSSTSATLNVTRPEMAAMGWCPSGRLFEAAACGAPVLSDAWEGMEAFFTPGHEILIADTTDEAMQALQHADLARIARAARERTLDEHTSARRAGQLLQYLEQAPWRAPAPARAEA
jgi:spore maturation protein CgeB